MSLYATEINNLLTQFKDENNMVEYYVIKQLFQKLELSEREIDFCISKISLTSTNIHCINYRELFEVFEEYE